jgi:putative ABC transport system permease protein
MLGDLVKYVLQNIMHRFMRSTLTILSILIGIMAIYALISFGQGVSKYVNDIAQQSGTDKLIAQPKGAGAPGTTGTFLSDDDLRVIKRENGVSEATGMITQQVEVKRKLSEKGRYTFLIGLSTDPGEARLVDEAFNGIKVDKGRALKSGDSGKAVVGHNYQLANKLFAKPLVLGDTIFLNGQPFEIVGFFGEVGNPQDDSQIYLTLEETKKLYDIGNEYGMIYVRAEKDVVPADLAVRLEDRLRRSKDEKVGQETFYVQTFEQLLQTFGVVITVLNGILVIIAGISVIVAAVNITNTMYTAVLERTREIGIMKAIGARNSYILLIFFIESGMLGLIGGVLGVLVGYGLAKLGGVVLAAVGYSLLKPYFPWWLTIGCLVFAFTIGALSGLLPAIQASKQKPVDALRYE